jgi:hypothetical protein
MSLKALSWAMEQDTLSTIEKMILTVLADHHNAETGQCNPSVKRLMLKSGVSRGSVHRALATLAEKELLTAAPATREDGSQTSNQYDLHTSRPSDTPLSHGDTPPSHKEPLPPQQGDPPLPPVGHLEPVRESIRNLEENSVAPAPSAKKKDGRRVTEITVDFLTKMHTRFDSAFGTQGVMERIDEAQSHKAWNNSTDKQAYITGWLRRDGERQSGGNNGHRPARGNPTYHEPGHGNGEGLR